MCVRARVELARSLTHRRRRPRFTTRARRFINGEVNVIPRARRARFNIIIRYNMKLPL